MRDYAKVEPKAWHGKTIRDLRKGASEGLQGALEGLVVGLYLMTSPSSNMLGLYTQPILYMAHETGLGLEGAWKGLRRCIEVGFCAYDEASEMVWIYEMARYQIAPTLKENDLRCKGIQREYDALADNPFLGDFFDRYQTAFHLKNRRCPEGAYQAPYQGASKPLRSQEQEQEQEQDPSEPIGSGVVTPLPILPMAELQLVGGENPAVDRQPDAIWDVGLDYLVAKGSTARSARGFLGQLRKTLDDLEVAELLAKAQELDVSEPLAWLRAAAQRRLNGGRSHTGVAL